MVTRITKKSNGNPVHDRFAHSAFLKVTKESERSAAVIDEKRGKIKRESGGRMQSEEKPFKTERRKQKGACNNRFILEETAYCSRGVFILAEVPEPFILHRRIIHIIPPVVIIRSVGYLSQGCHEHRSFVHGDSIPPRRNRRTPVYETVRHQLGVDLEKQKAEYSR